MTTCIANAKHFGDLEDPSSDVHRMVFADGARRVESAAIAVGPNVYYLGKPEHLDLVAASFPPQPARLVPAAKAWRSLVKPLVVAAVAATFLGQSVAFFSQLWNVEKDFED
mgnify:CR=1 FL=1